MKLLRGPSPQATPAMADWGLVIGRKFRCKGCGSVYEVSESDIRVIRYIQKHGHFATSCPTCGADCFIPVTLWQSVRNWFRR